MVGSLNQLRAELMLRYSAQHYWVRTEGRKIDAVFISSGRTTIQEARRSRESARNGSLRGRDASENDENP